MELEAGLGIDSIKRVEILAAVQDKLPGLPELDPQEIATIKTLGEIAEHMASYLNGGKPQPKKQETTHNTDIPVTETPTHTASTNAPDLTRFEVGIAPATDSSPCDLDNFKKVVLIPDDNGISDALKTILEREGFSVTITQLPSPDTDIVIFLSGLNDSVEPAQTLAIHESAFLAAHQVASRFIQSGGMFITVQDTGGRYFLDDHPSDSNRAWISGLPGLVKTAALEWPKALLKSIDLEKGDRPPETLAQVIFDELQRDGSISEVGLSAKGERVTPIIQAVSQPEPETLPIQSGDVVVVSGGARGVTPATLVPLAQSTQCRFVLLGRTPLVEEPERFADAKDDAALKALLLQEIKTRGLAITPMELNAKTRGILATREILQTLKNLEEAGSEVRYHAVDVRDTRALNTILEPIRHDWGPIRGVIHAAGVLADKAIADKTSQQFREVFETKVAGLDALLTATCDDPLKLLVFFSSIAARKGNQGQCDYAMANELLNKVAQVEARARGPECRVLSLNWGPWDGGMVTPALKAHFEKSGVSLIPLQAGGEFMTRELAGTSRSVELVIAGPENI